MFRRFIPWYGSGNSPAATCTARTVIGTEVLYQSFVWNIGVEMVSPVAWTLREVCTVQPLCRSTRFIGAADCASASASSNGDRESTRLIRIAEVIGFHIVALNRGLATLHTVDFAAAADKFFPKGGNPKIGHPTSTPVTPTTRNNFRANFRG